MERRFYRLSNRLLRLAGPLWVDLSVQGLEFVPRSGPVIVAINHTSFLDPMLVGSVMPRDVVMMAKAEAFRAPFLGLLVKWYGAFPIRRGEVDRDALKKALEVLRAGEALLMAPEGTRSTDGRLQPGFDGLALIAVRTQAPILPFAIAGGRPFSTNLKRFKRSRICVNIGQPYQPALDASKPGRERLAALTDDLMLRLARLLPPEQRGQYADRVSPDLTIPAAIGH
jgi:1-acyl-sn-glycerol-3-phosphate acyltransferase